LQTDAAATGPRLGPRVTGEFVRREQGEQRSAELEDREVLGIEYLRPAQTAVEVPLCTEVPHAQRDDVRQRRLP
jgi:hypothetical protein